MKLSDPSTSADEQRFMLYRNLRISGDWSAIGWYYVQAYPYALVAKYLWPDDARYIGFGALPLRRVLKTQDIQGNYSKTLTPDQLAPEAESLRALLVARKPAVLHMGVLGAKGRLIGVPAVTYQYELQHELFIDLDLKDYGAIRRLFCTCGPIDTCRSCWALVVMAAAICRAWLCDLLKLGPMLVVYSGGKGAHFHLGSMRARQLSPRQRHHLAMQLKDTDGHIRHAISHAAAGEPLASIGDAVLATWRRLVAADAKRFDAETHAHLTHWFAAQLGVEEKGGGAWWARLEAHPQCTRAALLNALLTILWPRIDMAVLDDPEQKKTIKAPFSIHAKTRRIALPLAESAQDECNPATMPAVTQLAQHVTNDPRWQAAQATMARWLTDCASVEN
jgi:hypothetical protein